jgi:N-6 DNA Methylase
MQSPRRPTFERQSRLAGKRGYRVGSNYGRPYERLGVRWLVECVRKCENRLARRLNRTLVRTIYDPAAGTGGRLSVAGEYLVEHNPQARLTMFGQELDDESYAICKADILIRGQDVTTSPRQHPLRRRPRALSLRLHAVRSTLRRRVEEGGEGRPEETRFNGRSGSLGDR